MEYTPVLCADTDYKGLSEEALSKDLEGTGYVITGDAKEYKCLRTMSICTRERRG